MNGSVADFGGADWLALLPIIVITAGAVGVMLAAAFYRSHALAAGLSALVLALAFIALPLAGLAAPRAVTPLLVVDGFALFYMGLIFAASLAVVLLAWDYIGARADNREEFYVLLLAAVLGAAVLTASSHFASFFLGLEILSVSLYGMIAYGRHHALPLEAGIKYLVLAGVSSAFLLFGMALIYADLGTLAFADMAVLSGDTSANAYLLTGLALIITGVGFKLSLAPFHLWTPDVYEGAPAPVTAFLATVSKGAVFALLLRWFAQGGVYGSEGILLALSVIAAASMLAGNLLALLQDNVKRILAYSSIAHLGYLLVAFLAAGVFAVEAVSFYLVAYFITTLGAFGVVSVLSAADEETDAANLADYRGLFWRRPWLAAVFTVMLLSLAGIPLTAGFIAKFYAFAAGVDAGLWLLVLVLAIGSAIGLYYYLRLIVTLYLSPAGDRKAAISTLSTAGALTLATLTAGLVWFGVYPAPLIGLIQAAAAALL